jgi:hypothetical protein
MLIKTLRSMLVLWSAMALICGGQCAAERDVTNNPTRWERLEQAYVLAEPLFLAQWPDTGHYALIERGRSIVPATFEDFEQHPHDWWYAEGYVKKFGKPGSYDCHLSIIGVVPEGTIVRVRRLTQMHSEIGGLSVKVWARILDPRFNRCEVLLDHLMYDVIDDNPSPVAKPQYLLPLDYRA